MLLSGEEKTLFFFLIEKGVQLRYPQIVSHQQIFRLAQSNLKGFGIGTVFCDGAVLSERCNGKRVGEALIGIVLTTYYKQMMMVLLQIQKK